MNSVLCPLILQVAIVYSKDETLAEIGKIQSWRHRIDVGHGIVTPGRNDTERDVAYLSLPEDMTGKRVLDIGCSDGYFSFLCEERGAEVVSVDHVPGLPGKPGQHGFRIAAKLRGSQARFHWLSVYDMNKIDGEFDIILFLNVLYHLKHPLLALENVYGKLVEGGEMYLKTFFYQDFRYGKYGFDIFSKSLCRFYEKNELNNDYSNWWAPNKRCLEGMIRCTGFRDVRFLARYSDRLYYKTRKSK